MKKSIIKLLTVEFMILTFFLINIFVINIINLYIISGIMLLFMILVIFLLGYEKSQKRFKKDVILNFIIYTTLFQIILYILGLIFGYLNNGYSMLLINIIKNIIPILFIIIVSEIMRYCINTKGQDSKIILILSVIMFVVIDISLQSYLFDFHSKKDIVELICTVILQSISKNILMTYISIKYGFQCNIIYRFIMELPIYFIPIIPDIDIYLNAVFNLAFPALVLYLTHKSYEKKQYIEVSLRDKNYSGIITKTILIVICIITVSLTSGIFPIYTLSVGSESMEPNINKGDIILVHKIKKINLNKLSTNDVLVFKYEDKTVVHRIVEITDKNDQLYFKTKGDNNNTIDDWTVEEKDVIGTVKIRIKYIGYTTVWLNEYLN